MLVNNIISSLLNQLQLIEKAEKEKEKKSQIQNIIETIKSINDTNNTDKSLDLVVANIDQKIKFFTAEKKKLETLIGKIESATVDGVKLLLLQLEEKHKAAINTLIEQANKFIDLYVHCINQYYKTACSSNIQKDKIDDMEDLDQLKIEKEGLIHDIKFFIDHITESKKEFDKNGEFKKLLKSMPEGFKKNCDEEIYYIKEYILALYSNFLLEEIKQASKNLKNLISCLIKNHIKIPEINPFPFFNNEEINFLEFKQRAIEQSETQIRLANVEGTNLLEQLEEGCKIVIEDSIKKINNFIDLLFYFISKYNNASYSSNIQKDKIYDMEDLDQLKIENLILNIKLSIDRITESKKDFDKNEEFKKLLKSMPEGFAQNYTGDGDIDGIKTYVSYSTLVKMRKDADNLMCLASHIIIEKFEPPTPNVLLEEYNVQNTSLSLKHIG